MASTILQRAGRRLMGWIGAGIVALVGVLAILVPSSYVAVEETSKPQFCRSCHLMEPYYDSWERSAHADVKCTECHFEPGTLGTVRGKFQAITQLAKYVTRTQGTRPWADVSDASCERSGCHSQSSLEGPLAFGRVAFDHAPHLLEARGQRLRCVTCHSQVLVDQHFAVQPEVCFACHFHPEDGGGPPARTSDCRLCHGPPEGALEVAGRAFEHAPYLARGVACRDCHAGVVAGTGTVHAQRCRSCHGEPEKLAQLGDPARLHRAHVTDKKVECAECHVEIQHGAEALATGHPPGEQACDACHAQPHQAALLVYGGQGANGVEPRPSRMHETHVACAACHTGRAGASAPGSAGLARAGEVDCLHCHGTGFAGMLGEGQRAVEHGLEGLQPMLAELGGAAPAGEAHVRELLASAGEDLALLRRDGSRGAHNPTYALDVLRAAAQRIDEARVALDPGAVASAAALLPAAADAACAACHLDVAQHDPLSVRARDFRHAPHLGAAGLTCGACHLAEPHGAPAWPRAQCANCHHAESPGRDPSACAGCHALQESLLRGTLAGHEEVGSVMADKACTECHGEPPELLIPPPSLCVLCHEEGYDLKLEAWRGATDGLVARLEQALAGDAPPATPEARARARQALATVAADGSRGVHNAELVRRLLEGALADLGAD